MAFLTPDLLNFGYGASFFNRSRNHMSDTVVIRTYSNEPEAHLAAAALEAHGVACQVISDNAGGALAAMSVLFPIRVIVHRMDETLARRVLDGVPDSDDETEPEAE